MAQLWANDRLRLVVTSKCNINCFYCHNEGTAKGTEFLSESLFERIADLIQQSAPKTVTFTGGEALLHPRLDTFIRAVKRHSSSVTLVTNGILLEPARIEALVGAGLTKVRLGVDSLRNEKTRPSDGRFPKVNPIELITAIQAYPLRLELNIVVTKFNLSELSELFWFCAKQRISAKIFEHVEVERFGTANASASFHRKPIIGFPELEDTLRRTGLPFRTDEATDLTGANVIISGNGFSWRYCRYLCPFGLCYMTGTRIDPTGEAYACMERRFVESLAASGPLRSDMAKLEKIAASRCSGEAH